MRKTFIILSIVLMNVQEGFTQINPNTWLLDGGTAFSYTSSTNASLQNVSFALRAGIFAAPNFALGTLVAYAETTQSIPQLGVTSTKSIAIFGGFLRYYAEGKVFLGIGYNWVLLLATGSRDASTTQIPLELGYAGFVAHNLAIEPVMYYIIGENSNTFSIGIGFGLYFGRGRKDEATQ